MKSRRSMTSACWEDFLPRDLDEAMGWGGSSDWVRFAAGRGTMGGGL